MNETKPENWKLSTQYGRDMHDSPFTEAICEHGIGHHKGIHGCDGCCATWPKEISDKVSTNMPPDNTPKYPKKPTGRAGAALEEPMPPKKPSDRIYQIADENGGAEWPNRDEKMREEFQAWADAGLWEGEDEYTKNFRIEDVSSWWLSKMEEVYHVEHTEEQIVKNMQNSKSHIGDALHSKDFIPVEHTPEWAVEFDEKFLLKSVFGKCINDVDGTADERIKDFISSLLEQTKKEAEERVLREVELPVYDHSKCPIKESCIGYQDAESDLYNVKLGLAEKYGIDLSSHPTKK